MDVGLPDVVSLAVELLVAHETRACLVEHLLAVRAPQTSDVPLEVGRHAQDVLVEDLVTASHTDGRRTSTPHLPASQRTLSCCM